MGPQFSLYLAFVSIGSTFLPFAGWFVRRQNTAYLRVLMTWVGLAVILEICSMLLQFSNKNNLFLLHLDTLLEAILLLALFSQVLGKKLPLWTIILPALIILAFEVAQFIWVEAYFQRTNPYSRSMLSLMVIGVCLYHLYFVMLSEVPVKWAGASPIWITSGILLYFSGNLTLFVLTDHLIFENPQVDAQNAFIIHSSLNILKFVLITAGVVLLPKKIAEEGVSFSGQ